MLVTDAKPAPAPAPAPTPAPAPAPAPVCSRTVAYNGPEVCLLFSVDAEKLYYLFQPLFGAVMILFGIILSFFGAKFLF